MWKSKLFYVKQAATSESVFHNIAVHCCLFRQCVGSCFPLCYGFRLTDVALLCTKVSCGTSMRKSLRCAVSRRQAATNKQASEWRFLIVISPSLLVARWQMFRLLKRWYLRLYICYIMPIYGKTKAAYAVKRLQRGCFALFVHMRVCVRAKCLC